LGHHTGDKLLITVVSTIGSHIRNTDILARFGGDEFVILLPETAGEAARSSLDKIHQKLQEAMSAHSWPVTFSIGAVSYLQAPDSIDDAVRAADALMYEVKRSGKNRLLHVTAGEHGPANSTEELHGTRRL
jgi:diguanylate cyclase (GGDEF)-like protein